MNREGVTTESSEEPWISLPEKTSSQVEDFFLLLDLGTEEARAAASFENLKLDHAYCAVNVFEMAGKTS